MKFKIQVEKFMLLFTCNEYLQLMDIISDAKHESMYILG